MRENKFRAWDKDSKKMYYVLTDIHALISGEITRVKWCTSEIDAGWLNNFELMEYIGRQDKNGKYIYEGDVIINEEDGKGKVEFFTNLNWDGGGSSHSGFYVKEWFKYGNEGGLSYHEGFDGCELIGNIYENPELIKGGIKW